MAPPATTPFLSWLPGRGSGDSQWRLPGPALGFGGTGTKGHLPAATRVTPRAPALDRHVPKPRNPPASPPRVLSATAMARRDPPRKLEAIHGTATAWPALVPVLLLLLLLLASIDPAGRRTDSPDLTCSCHCFTQSPHHYVVMRKGQEKKDIKV